MKNQKNSLTKLTEIAQSFRAIANPNRMAIIDILEKNGKMNVTQIYTKLKMDQAAASQHLIILKKNGLISSNRIGKCNYYSLNPDAFQNVIECIDLCHK